MLTPNNILLNITKSISENYEEFDKTNADMLSFVKDFQNLPDIRRFDLETDDVLIIAILWEKHIEGRYQNFEPVEILYRIYGDKSECITQLDRIIKLLKKQILYTSKRLIMKETRQVGEPVKIEFFKSSLLEHDVSLHREFVKLILGERVDISEKSNEPYRSNKEFISDWFSYVTQLYEFSFWDFSDRKFGAEMDESQANDFLKAQEWKSRIDQRMKITKEVFPLMDIVSEYNLDENETVILAYLAKEEMENNNVDTDEVVKLISRDQHEMYENRKYISAESNLVKNGLIELSENVFFRSKGGELRILPDITRRIIMRTPVTDDDRLNQILKGNGIFSLLEPTHTMADLILPNNIKKTLKTALKRYHKKTDAVLNDWGLFSGMSQETGKPQKEHGLLMLFYGAPGTGKTFGAGAIAESLGKKILVTDMSRIQSMWVGESEKNVRRLFALYERIVRRVENPPILLLNEADQFLGRRIKGNNSIDRMMNTLQNLFLESFENLNGILIATTNLRDNFDTAFSRRFHLKMEFPLPGVAERKKLWRLHLPNTIPGTNEIDTFSLAKSYSLTGGQIFVIVKNAATEAAARIGKLCKLTQADLIKYCDIETASMFDRKKNRIGFLA